MSELSALLKDPSRSGVYGASRADTIAEAVLGSKLNVGRVSLRGADTKDALLQRMAKCLAFPDWFGENWDALEDCLTDLSWCEAEGHVLIFEAYTPSDDLGILIDVLASSAEFWAARNRAFYAVFIDPDRMLGLADLANAG
jgi:hypothetical protein